MHDGKIVTADMVPRHLLHRKPQHDHMSPATLRTEAAPLQDAVFENMTLAEIERYAIESAVRRTGGNIPLAAAHLGVAPSYTLQETAFLTPLSA
jgi:two-component system repressor protein LuxO